MLSIYHLEVHGLIFEEQDFAAAEKKALAVGAKKFFLEVCGTAHDIETFG